MGDCKMGQVKESVKNIDNFEEEVKKILKRELKNIICEILQDCLKEKGNDLNELKNNKDWKIIV